jgi:hypothetical protein
MNASANQARFDISEAMDNCPVGRFHARIYALCLICLVMDGFDLQALGFAAPALISDWGIKSPALGPVFGAGNLGVLVGALVFSVVADKVGRRPVLIGATLFFSIATLWNARVTSVPELLIIRFFSGIGLGCIIPNATALVGEYSHHLGWVHPGSRDGRPHLRDFNSVLWMEIGVLFRRRGATGNCGCDVSVASGIVAISGSTGQAARACHPLAFTNYFDRAYRPINGIFCK